MVQARWVEKLPLKLLHGAGAENAGFFSTKRRSRGARPFLGREGMNSDLSVLPSILPSLINHFIAALKLLDLSMEKKNILKAVFVPSFFPPIFNV